MARKGKTEQAVMDGDTLSPDITPRPSSKPAKSRAAKAGQRKPAITKPKTVPKKTPAKPAPAAKPRASNAPRRTAEKEGNTQIPNPVALSPKQHEALQVANLHGLDARQAKFVDLWLVSFNGAESYRAAGYKCKNDNVAAAGASKLLKKVKHHPYTQARHAEIFARTADMQNEVLSVIRAGAYADPRELTEYRIRCCRYCYGTGFKYQFKPSEMEKRQSEYDAMVKEAEHDGHIEDIPDFDALGGLGYDAKREPHPDCPECSGEGYGRAVFKDTSKLSPAALALYEGTKEGKDGTEIKIASQRAYRELLVKILDLTIEPAVVVNAGVSDEQLNAVLQTAEARTAALREEMLERERLIRDGALEQ